MWEYSQKRVPKPHTWLQSAYQERVMEIPSCLFCVSEPPTTMLHMLVSFLAPWQIPELNQLSKGTGLFWLRVSEVSTHAGWPAVCEVEHQGRDHRVMFTSWKLRSKRKKNRPVSQPPFTSMSPVFWHPSIRPHILDFPFPFKSGL